MSEGAHSENPYRPVDLPEFGVSVGWAMCRNAMCPNFGIQYAGPAPAGAEIADDRYTINTVEGQLTCRYCDDSFKLNSNRAIRTLARHFLSLSLPFATCPNPACENFGRNAFEHHPTERRVRGRPYRRQRGEYRMRCRLCRDKASTFPLGEALHLVRSPAAKKRLRGIIRGAMYVSGASAPPGFQFEIGVKAQGSS